MPHKTTREVWARYWRAYGGVSELCRSFYFHASLFVTAISYPFWTREGWWEVPIGALPNLLGFTLGGLAILLGLAEARVIRLLSSDGGGQNPSELAGLVASFAHFVVIQGLALVAALLCRTWYVTAEEVPAFAACLRFLGISWTSWARYTSLFGWFLSYLLFVYAILLVFATVMAVSRVSRILEMVANSPALDDDHDRSGK